MAWAGDKPFVVVIDAGHGGKDPGASGYVLKLKEKDINLKTALKLGDLLSKEKNVKVLYTRKKDVFIPLDDRAQIANKAKADLFISIHVNAAENRSAKGTESYAVGSSSANLEVAKRENAVMLYESDYKTKYRGFDPNSTESYIMFDFLQSKYMEQSIAFASGIERSFVKAGRSSRGVKQAGFWVLKQAAMPAVLVELGYISNREEEAFLSKDKNLDKLAESIAKAFVQYKNRRDKRNSDGYKDIDVNQSESVTEVQEPKKETVKEPEKSAPSAQKDTLQNNKKEVTQADGKESVTKKQETEPQPKQNTSNAEVTEKPQTEDKPSAPTETKKSQLYYAVQFCSSSSQKPLNCKDFKKCVPAQEFVETGTYKYKYVYGRAATFEEGVKLRDEVKTVFKDAFLVVIKDGKKLPMEEARQYFKSSK
jgi:N-acetylmuramoyl-L-alanine amidase